MHRTRTNRFWGIPIWGGGDFLPLYTSTLVSVRVSQKIDQIRYLFQQTVSSDLTREYPSFACRFISFNSLSNDSIDSIIDSISNAIKLVNSLA